VHPGRRQPPSPPATKSKRWSGTGSSARAARYFARVASAPPLEKRAYVVMAPRDIAGDLGPVLVGSGWKEPEHDGDDTSAIDGVTSPWAYISLAALTGACLHLEDLALARVNHLQARRPKLWDVVSPTRDNVEGLERLCRRLVPAGNEITDECGQAVRHRALLLAPEEMDAQGIKHKLVPQLEGEMVVPLPWAYHQVINLGPNVAMAVNFALTIGCCRNITSATGQKSSMQNAHRGVGQPVCHESAAGRHRCHTDIGRRRLPGMAGGRDFSARHCRN